MTDDPVEQTAPEATTPAPPFTPEQMEMFRKIWLEFKPDLPVTPQISLSLIYEGVKEQTEPGIEPEKEFFGMIKQYSSEEHTSLDLLITVTKMHIYHVGQSLLRMTPEDRRMTAAPAILATVFGMVCESLRIKVNEEQIAAMAVDLVLQSYRSAPPQIVLTDN